MKHTRWWSRTVAVTAATVLALTTAACAGGSDGGSGSDDIDPDATLRINLPVSSSLNPTEIPIASSAMISLWPVYERLIEVDGDGEYDAMLATDWAFSDDGLTLTLNLRDDVTFSDGTPFDAAAAKTSLDYLRTSPASSSSTPLKTVADIQAPSATQLVITLSTPSTSIIGALASPISGSMISPEAIASGDLASQPVGTGAWVVSAFNPGVEVTYERREDGIWDEESGQVKTVQIATFTSAEARTNAIRSGQYDLTTYAGSDAPALGSEIDSGRLQLSQSTGFLMYSMFLNTASAPFDDVAVRQAVNYALDRDNLKGVIDEASDSRVQPYPDGLVGFDEGLESDYGFDVDEAKKLLADAGYPDGLDAGLVLVANTGGFPELAQAVQANLKDVGISIELQSIDVLQANAEWSKGGASGLLMYQSPPDLEPVGYFTKNYLNPFWFVGDTPAELVGLLDGIGDPRREAEQSDLIGAVNEYATDNALFAPILQKPTGYVAAPKVRNFESSPFAQFGGADFRYVYLTK